MTKNIGTVDKVLRLVIGFALIVYGVTQSSLLGFIGIIPIATAAFSLCPLYSILGINTQCSISNETKD